MAYAEFKMALNADFRKVLSFYQAKDIVEDLTGVAWSGAMKHGGATIASFGPVGAEAATGLYMPDPTLGQVIWTILGSDIDTTGFGGDDPVRVDFDLLGKKDGLIRRRLEGVFEVARGTTERPA